MTERSSAAVTTGIGSMHVEVPSDWDRYVFGGPLMLVARPRTWRGSFTPTINVTRTRTPGVATLADYLDVQIAGIVSTVGGHLVHLAASYRPQPHLDLTLSTEGVGIDLTVIQRHLVEPHSPDGSGWVSAVATAVSADRDWPQLAPALVSAVLSMRAVER